MMSMTMDDYRKEYWPLLQSAITQLLRMTPGDHISISYEEMYRSVRFTNS